MRVAGDEGGLGDEEDDGGDRGEREPERVRWAAGGLCWAGECKGLSVEVFEVGAGTVVEFGVRMGEGEDGVVCSLAG